MQIKTALEQIGREYVSYAAALIVSAEYRERAGNLDIMPKGCHQKSADELAAMIRARAEAEQSRISVAIDLDEIVKFSKDTVQKLEASFSPSTLWKNLIPGRTILSVFCSTKYAGMDFGRFKTAYIRAAEDVQPNPFAEVEEIFGSFSAIAPRSKIGGG